MSGAPLVFNDAVGTVRSILTDPLAAWEVLPALSVAVALMLVSPAAVTLSCSVAVPVGGSMTRGCGTQTAGVHVELIDRMPDRRCRLR